MNQFPKRTNLLCIEWNKWEIKDKTTTIDAMPSSEKVLMCANKENSLIWNWLSIWRHQVDRISVFKWLQEIQRPRKKYKQTKSYTKIPAKRMNNLPCLWWIFNWKMDQINQKTRKWANLRSSAMAHSPKVKLDWLICIKYSINSNGIMCELFFSTRRCCFFMSAFNRHV